jgi:hypothetical protein
VRLNHRALGLGLAMLVSASMWFYVQRIQVFYQVKDAAIRNQPRGNFSDLYPRWLGTRELLLHNRDPYGPEVTREIQEGYYGRALDPNNPSDPKDQQGFAYPLYVVFLLAPFMYLPFHTVQIIWFWALLLWTAASVLFWLRASNWRPSRWTVATLIVLTLGSFPVVQGLKLQQLTLLVAGLIAISLALLVRGQLVWAGILIAVCTIKPQLTMLLIVWLLLWTLGDWNKRWRFAAAFAATMAVFFAGSQLISPGWISRFVNALSAYRRYTGGAETSLDVLLTPFIGRIVGGLLVVMLLAVCWRIRNIKPGSSSFILMTSMVLAITVSTVSKVAPYNHLLLLPAVFFVLQRWVPFRVLPRSSRALMAIATIMLVWPWLASLVLTVLSVVLPIDIVLRGWMVPLYTSVGMPLAFVALLTPLVVSLWNHEIST